MTITKFSDKYLKIISDYIQDAITNPEDYDSIEVTGNINCCASNCGNQEASYIIPVLNNNKWVIDLTEAVYLNSTLQKINVQSLSALNTVNALTTPIELSYVEDNCSESTLCTLETFSSYFTSLFKTELDNFFTSIGLTTNVTVTISGNEVIFEDFPAGWGLFNVEHGNEEPYTLIPFGYNELGSQAFLGTDGLYVPSTFFSMEEYENGIYHFGVKIYKADGASFIYEENCAFIDIDIKCKVAALLNKIVKEANNTTDEKVSTVAHMLHYGLVNGSNCGCNCSQMCEVYRELISIINSADPSIYTDCGC